MNQFYYIVEHQKKKKKKSNYMKKKDKFKRTVKGHFKYFLM